MKGGGGSGRCYVTNVSSQIKKGMWAEHGGTDTKKYTFNFVWKPLKRWKLEELRRNWENT